MPAVRPPLRTIKERDNSGFSNAPFDGFYPLEPLHQLHGLLVQILDTVILDFTRSSKLSKIQKRLDRIRRGSQKS